MYLEISPRRTGKTQRLIQQMMIDIEQNGITPIVFVPNVSHRENHWKRLTPFYRKKILWVNDQQEYLQVRQGINNYKIFVDEFDAVNWEFPLMRDGYYVSTLMYSRELVDVIKWMLGERKDSYLSLLSMNGYKFESHSLIKTLSSMTLEQIRNLQTFVDSEHFEVEFGNRQFIQKGR